MRTVISPSAFIVLQQKMMEVTMWINWPQVGSLCGENDGLLTGGLIVISVYAACASVVSMISIMYIC